MSDEAKRVKVSEAMVKELSKDWSPPVQVRIEGTDDDGDLELWMRFAFDDDAEPGGGVGSRKL